MGALIIIAVGTGLGTLLAIAARHYLRRALRSRGSNWWGWL
jgi:hypothetical protein